MLKVPSRPLTVISEDQLEALHRASLRLLEQVGVEMLDGQALDLLASRGATVDWSTQRVRIPGEMIVQAVSQAPARFTLRGRNPCRDVEVGGDVMVLAPVGGPMMVEDPEKGRRYGSYADQVQFLKLTHQSRLLDITYRYVEAVDLPPSTRHLDYMYAALRYSDKPIGVMSLVVTPGHLQTRGFPGFPRRLFPTGRPRRPVGLHPR